MRVVDAGLARGDAHAGDDDRLHAHQKLIVAIDARGRRDHDSPWAAVGRDHRPRRGRVRRQGALER
jgi:hypothetical protein